MRTPGAVPNLCKADSGLSAMIGIMILVAISSHLSSLSSPSPSLSWGDFFLGVLCCLGIHCKTLYVKRQNPVGP